MSNDNPLSYTGKITGSTARLGVVEFKPTDFSVSESGVVSLSASGALQSINSQSPVDGNFVIAGTSNQISVSDATGTTTLSLPSALTAPGSLTATTSITATAGDITATLGHLILNGAAKQIRIHGGAVTDFIGTATLTAGTVTIANTNIAATDRIIVMRIAAGASTTLGMLTYTISAATSFTITSVILGTPGSTQTGDISSIFYVIIRQV